MTSLLSHCLFILQSNFYIPQRVKHMVLFVVLWMKVTRKFKRFPCVVWENWEYTKHKGRGNCSLHGAIVKPSSKYFLLYSLTNTLFRFLLSSVTLNLSKYALFIFCSTLAVGPLIQYQLHFHFDSCTFFKSLIFILLVKIHRNTLLFH